jgi:hypothetical protein
VSRGIPIGVRESIRGNETKEDSGVWPDWLRARRRRRIDGKVGVREGQVVPVVPHGLVAEGREGKGSAV